MCNRYTVKASPQELAEVLDAFASPSFEVGSEEHVGEVFPYDTSPGLLLNRSGRRELRPMQFSITPPWSREPKVKYQSNNARIEDIESKKTFIGPLRSQRCVIPLSSFVEPCYWGETAGKEVEFQRHDGSLFHVAGIYSIWRGTTTMAFLMRPASRYVMEHGHHRQPIFISRTGIDPWLEGGDREPSLSKEILRRFAEDEDLQYTVLRQMAPAWKSRQPGMIAKREQTDESW